MGLSSENKHNLNRYMGVAAYKASLGDEIDQLVKYAGQLTSVGGAAAEAFTVTGLASTDLVFVQVKDNGTNNVTVLQAVPTADTLTITFSADPGNDAVVYYLVHRP